MKSGHRCRGFLWLTMTKTALSKPLCGEMENLLVLSTDLAKGTCITCCAGKEHKKVVECYAGGTLQLRTQTLGVDGSKWLVCWEALTRPRKVFSEWWWDASSREETLLGALSFRLGRFFTLAVCTVTRSWSVILREEMIHYSDGSLVPVKPRKQYLFISVSLLSSSILTPFSDTGLWSLE